MKYLWHCHHIDLIEAQIFPMKKRREHIRKDKLAIEVPLRLLLFRRAVIETDVEVAAVRLYFKSAKVNSVLKRLHKEQCEPDCPWTLKGGIFTKFSRTLYRYVTKKGPVKTS